MAPAPAPTPPGRHASPGHRARPGPGLIRHEPGLARPIALVAACGTLATLLEGLALVGVVWLAAAASAGDPRVAIRLGPVARDLGAGSVGAAIVVLLVAATIAQLTGGLLRGRLTASWGHRRRRRFVSRFLAADHRSRQALGAAGLQTLNTAVGQAAGAIDAAAGALKALTSAAVLVAVAVVVQPLAAVGLAVTGALLHGAARPLTRRARHLTRLQADTGLVYATGIDELARVHRELTVYGSGPAFADRLDAISARFARLQSRVISLGRAVAPLYQAATIALATTVLVVVVSWAALDATQVGAAAVLLLRGLAYGQQFQNSLHRLRETEPYIEQVEQLESALTPPTAAFGSSDPGPLETLVVDHLRFRHPGAARAVSVEHLECHRGEVIAVTGPSGEGKTTLAELLVRLRLPDEGTITVNGIPHTSVDPAWWARRVAFVPQNPPLVTATVADNVDLWRGLPRADVEAALEAAGLADEIAELDDGPDTLVGPGGRNLSGGQLQRLAIARALAGGPSLLVLDEPTSALDHVSERRVRAALAACRESMIVVVVTHRESTLGIADRHLHLEGGRLTERMPGPAPV